ncbi:MAG: hypothetical protein HC927_07500, partial [Deltaproteobacteria bacterium]|nr:hypothetical protein [Deltaproteobacteria bacterium]
AVFERDATQVLQRFERITESGSDLLQLALAILQHLRDLTVIKLTGSRAALLDISDDLFDQCVAQANQVEATVLAQCFDRFSRVLEGLENSRVPKLVIEMGLLELVQADVLEIEPGSLEPADIVAALNFSFCVFKQREQLRRYFANVHGGLAEQGLLILEIFGGTKAIDLDEEERELDAFTYHWEQEWFNPLTNEILCHIHFEFPDGSKLDKAFTYDWRLWSVPELRDLLYEVGFSDVKIYWEKVEEESEDDEDEDDDGMLRGTGEYEQLEEAEQQDSWLVYVVGVR